MIKLGLEVFVRH